MRKSYYRRVVQYVTPTPSCIPEFIQVLSEQCCSPIAPITPQSLMEASPLYKNRILLFEYEHSLELFQQVVNLPLVSKDYETILINVPRRLTTQEVLHYGHLKALFYCHEALDKLVIGINEVVNGKNWLPRDVTSQLLHHYRHMVLSNTAPTVVDLTSREIQILRSLQSGASNLQMAEDLFIAESTVKSHLYQIFRKLSVKNRIQAIAWANQNLLS
jgi:DNA-binding CsgD family transcriptional regulator